MILAFGDTDVEFPVREVLSIWPLVVSALLSLLIIAAYHLGRRSGRRATSRPESWSRTEVLTAVGVIVMVATLLVTLLNPEVRKWLGLP
jgi:heme/copper-type cytochrome/quinol oxidase subunit 1